MKVAAFQFAAGPDIAVNLVALERGIDLAAAQGVRFLLTQECGLTGYPPLETPSVTAIDQSAVDQTLARLQVLASAQAMYIAIGCVRPAGVPGRFRNELIVLSPEGPRPPSYAKRALWGWDQDNFIPGSDDGILEIDGWRIGLRLCFEIRFPEYFRQLYVAKVDLACVAFCDTGSQSDASRYQLIKAHLLTRAVENAMPLLSANSISRYQTAPSCLIDADGAVLQQAPTDREFLLVHDLQKTAVPFGRQGRINHSNQLISDANRASGALDGS